jgi:hypothetical protein
MSSWSVSQKLSEPASGRCTPGANQHQLLLFEHCLAVDFYRTPIECVKLASDLMDENLRWWEPCAGDGAISSYYPEITFASDIKPVAKGINRLDVLRCDKPRNVDAIITNPPFFAAYDVLERALGEWKIPALLLIRIEPLSTQKRNAYTKRLSQMHIVSNLVKFETDDGRIVNGNGTMRCAWCSFEPGVVRHTITRWMTYEDSVVRTRAKIPAKRVDRATRLQPVYH